MANGLIQHARRPWLIVAVVVVVIVSGYAVWRHFSTRESTDDAQVSGHVSPIAPRVGGTVVAVLVADNQSVHVGDPLAQIDPHDYEIALARAQADLAAAQAAARAAGTNVPIASTTTASAIDAARAGTGNAEAAVQAAEREVDASRAKLAVARARLDEVTANATRAAQDLERLKPLIAKDEISKQQFDAAVATEQAARAGVASAQAAVGEAQANVDVASAKRVQATAMLAAARSQATAADTGPEEVALTKARAAGAEAQVLQAQTAVEQAKLNLERTAVRALASGVISRKTVEVGQVVQAGQPIMAITSLDDVWVTANFKETQLREMHPGQRADVSVDAYGGRKYAGRVESIAAATGATFSLLPPDNASGNFVKVVQRVPIRIVIEDGQNAAAILRPGMSVSATVFIR
jgi:membrane fusion protein (multidrug efflux system)